MLLCHMKNLNQLKFNPTITHTSVTTGLDCFGRSYDDRIYKGKSESPGFYF